MKDIIKKEHQYQAAISDVWNAITKAEEISEWFIKAEFKAEVGYHYTFTHENTVISGKVLKVDPVYNLVYTWNVGGTGVDTTVKWHLEENDLGTLLTLEHSGISNYPTSEMIDKMFSSFSDGWGSCITNLDHYLQKAKHA
jgi:uncharacterized protein YndB with AHSA1/START domain